MDYLVKIRSVQTPLNGQFSIGANTMCQKERGLLFLRPSRVAHVSARHAHHCRSSAGLVSHRFVSYRTAGTAFLEKLFTGFWGFEFWDASVAMGGLIE